MIKTTSVQRSSTSTDLVRTHIPKAIAQELNLKKGDILVWNCDKNTKEIKITKLE